MRRLAIRRLSALTIAAALGLGLYAEHNIRPNNSIISKIVILEPGKDLSSLS